jgi:2'-hydroxyisoflavone reductase
MKVLILGGTLFLGRHLVEAALERGHEVTLFNRGRTNPELFPEVEKLRGDRDAGDLEALRGRSWDVVIDTSGYLPRVVQAAAQLLDESVDHYTFISSGSAYDHVGPPVDESSPTGELPEESEDVERYYGPLKALSERAVEDALPGRVFTVRAGLIVGPYDPTGRFTYWVWRIARGGDVLAPEPRDQPVQFIHARDLADWIVDQADRRLTGVFNAAGPEHELTMEQLLEEIRRGTESNARLRWLDESFLLEHGVEAWSDLPLWLAPDANPELAHFLAMDIRKALQAGLRFRPLVQTIRDTLEKAETTSDAGLDPARERELLGAA